MIKQTWTCSECKKTYENKEDAIKCEAEHEKEKIKQKKIIEENKKMIFGKSVKIHKSSFDNLGGCVDFKVPKDCNCVILMGNKGGGLIPYQLLLPHQVYVSDLKKTFKKEGFEVIVLIPIKSKDYMDVVYRDKYSEQRWNK